MQLGQVVHRAFRNQCSTSVRRPTSYFDTMIVPPYTEHCSPNAAWEIRTYALLNRSTNLRIIGHTTTKYSMSVAEPLGILAFRALDRRHIQHIPNGWLHTGVATTTTQTKDETRRRRWTSAWGGIRRNTMAPWPQAYSPTRPTQKSVPASRVQWYRTTTIRTRSRASPSRWGLGGGGRRVFFLAAGSCRARLALSLCAAFFSPRWGGGG